MFGFPDYKSMFRPDEILLYLRKSRSDDPLMSVEEVLQKHEIMLNEWCEANLGETIPESNRYREVVSGESISTRIAFQKLLKRVEESNVRAVLCVEVQRLGRPDLEEIGKITKIFRFTGITVITPQRAYNIQDEYDRDYFERELKRGNEYLEYQKKIMGRGRLLSVSQGNFISSVPPYGYNKVWGTDGKKKYPTLEENKEQADIVRLIFDMYVNKDKGAYLICKHLNGLNIQPPKGKYWSGSSLKEMLQNIHYIGKVKWNWRKVVTIVEDSEIIKTRPKAKTGEFLIYDGKHPAIISEELFNAAQDKIGRNHRTKSTTKLKNPLAGVIYCQCGRAMTLHFYKRNGVERSPARLQCDNQGYCGTGSCQFDEIFEIVCGILEKNIAEFEVKLESKTDDAVTLHNKIIANLEKKLAEVEGREMSLWESQADPDLENRMPLDVFKKLNAKILKEKEETRTALANARESMPTPIDYEDKIYRFKDALAALRDENVSVEDKNKLLKACIERIDYRRDKPVRIKKDKTVTTVKRCPYWETNPIELDVKLRV